MDTAIEVGWFIASIVALDYSIKHLGAAKTLWWAFAVSSLLYLSMAVPSLQRTIHRHHGYLTPRSLLVPGLLSALATIYGVAWWTLWKRKPSARGWAIAASVTYVLLSLFTMWSNLHLGRSIRGCSGVMLATGATGLVAFLRHSKARRTQQQQ